MPEILRMPEVAANTVEAILETWNIAVGTSYAAGEVIVTVETEKAVVDVEAETAGVLLQILEEGGATVAVGAPIAIWGTGSETAEEVDTLIASLGVSPTGTADVFAEAVRRDEPAVTRGPDEPKTSPPLPHEAADATAHAAPTESSRADRVFVSPLARRLARERGLDLTSLVGTGPGGRIRRIDIDTAGAISMKSVPMPDAQKPTEPAAQYKDVENSRMRQAIARRLTESKQSVPHFYIRGSARVDALFALRQDINAGATSRVSVNDLLVKAIALAHAEVPDMNVQWNGDTIRRFDQVDIAVAVATDGGLVTPVVRGVDALSISRLASTTADLIGRAKGRRLQQHELEGGSISITNLGMFGTEDFAAIINPPQAAILAVGAARPEAIVDEGAIVAAHVLHATLAVDHRPVDGATAATWMQAFLTTLENPLRILL
jgi:pyruvate dehydrogenase E2 component (dihydrolipoamide acetyltransferase)